MSRHLHLYIFLKITQDQHAVCVTALGSLQIVTKLCIYVMATLFVVRLRFPTNENGDNMAGAIICDV